jgi:hypothetical protein
MSARRALRTLVLFMGMLQMTSIQAGSPRPADPMRGPDFVMQKVASWVEHPGADSQLVLADGSRWHLDPHRADYAAQVTFIALALKAGEAVLVSGSQARGDVDRIGDTRKLAAKEVADHDVDGLVVVTFHGPPSIYRVRMSRPGAAHDLVLLRNSVASGAFFDTPDLLVGIDTRAKEVVAVEPLASAPAR